jgi:hypothetical protein
VAMGREGICYVVLKQNGQVENYEINEPFNTTGNVNQ